MGRIASLEAARGVAALMVVAVHVNSFHALDRVPQAGWLHFTTVGWLGVQVFFVLSGLVLYLPYARGKQLELGAYARARLLRVVPGLWVVLAVSATVLGLWSWALVRHALFVNPAAVPGLDPVPPSWTLTIEMGFYALLPALVWLFARRPVYPLPILLCLVGVGILSRELYMHGSPMTPLTYVDNFALGVLAAIVVARVGHVRGRWLTVAAATAAAGLMVSGEWVWTILAAGVLFAVTLGLVAAVNPATPRALVWLGTVSYGIYLWHWPILEVATDHGLYRLPDALEVTVVAAASVVLGWVSWRLVERPALSLRRRRAETGSWRLAPRV